MPGARQAVVIHQRAQTVAGCLRVQPARQQHGAGKGLRRVQPGAGQDQEGRPAAPVRSNTLRDYLGEKFTPLGVQRIGPDLTNYGWRAPAAAVIHRKLYAPHSLNDWSTMPAYKHLYKLQKIQGPASERALKLTGKFAPPAGFEVVPTAEADRLVEYLLSLKKDFPVPGQAAVAAAKK